MEAKDEPIPFFSEGNEDPFLSITSKFDLNKNAKKSDQPAPSTSPSSSATASNNSTNKNKPSETTTQESVKSSQNELDNLNANHSNSSIEDTSAATGGDNSAKSARSSTKTSPKHPPLSALSPKKQEQQSSTNSSNGGVVKLEDQYSSADALFKNIKDDFPSAFDSFLLDNKSGSNTVDTPQSQASDIPVETTSSATSDFVEQSVTAAEPSPTSQSKQESSVSSANPLPNYNVAPVSNEIQDPVIPSYATKKTARNPPKAVPNYSNMTPAAKSQSLPPATYGMGNTYTNTANNTTTAEVNLQDRYKVDAGPTVSYGMEETKQVSYSTGDASVHWESQVKYYANGSAPAQPNQLSASQDQLQYTGVPNYTHTTINNQYHQNNVMSETQTRPHTMYAYPSQPQPSVPNYTSYSSDNLAGMQSVDYSNVPTYAPPPVSSPPPPNANTYPSIPSYGVATSSTPYKSPTQSSNNIASSYSTVPSYAPTPVKSPPPAASNSVPVHDNTTLHYNTPAHTKSPPPSTNPNTAIPPYGNGYNIPSSGTKSSPVAMDGPPKTSPYGNASAIQNDLTSPTYSQTGSDTYSVSSTSKYGTIGRNRRSKRTSMHVPGIGNQSIEDFMNNGSKNNSTSRISHYSERAQTVKQKTSPKNNAYDPPMNPNPNAMKSVNDLIASRTADDVQSMPPDYDRKSMSSSWSNYMDMKQCTKCAKFNEADANFCSKCGNSNFTVSATPNAGFQGNGGHLERNSQPPENHSISSDGMPRQSIGSPFYPVQEVAQKNDEEASNASSESISDPLKRVGCPVISFGAGGKMIIMKPHTQKRFVNVNGQLTEVEKVMPGFLKITNAKDLLGDSSFVKDVKMVNGPILKKKKKDVVKLLEDLIAADQSQDHANYLSLLQFLLLLVQNGGKMSSIANVNQVIIEKVLKPDLSLVEKLEPLDAEINQPSSEILAQVRKSCFEGKYEEAIALLKNAKCWTHALIIASRIDKEAFNSLVEEFSAASLARKDPLYTFFAMNSGKKVDEKTENNADVSNQWREHVAMILANKKKGSDYDAALIKLGDGLCAVHKVYAGHLCYLLAGLLPDASPNAKIRLLGSNATIKTPNLAHKAIHLTEIYEFIMRLQSSETILLHFQVHKLQYASQLADYGLMQEASKYCESILSAIKDCGKQASYFEPQFLTSLTDFKEKLKSQGYVAMSSEENSWFTGFISKIETTMSSVIGVDEKKISPRVSYAPHTNMQGVPGIPGMNNNAYLNYNSSNNSSNLNSPYGNHNPMNGMPGNSAGLNRYSYPSVEANNSNQYQPNFHANQNQNVVNPYQNTYQQAGNPMDGRPMSLDMRSNTNYNMPQTNYNMAPTNSFNNQYGGNTGSVNGNNMNGFQPPNTQYNTDPIDDDLSLGNGRLKPKVQNPAPPSQESPSTQQKQPEEKKEDDKNQSSIFGAFIRKLPFMGVGKTENVPKAVTAKLGEENSFYYDEVLKKWVNSASKEDTSRPETPLAPPPITPALSRSASVGGNYPTSSMAPPSTPNVMSAINSRVSSPLPDGGTLRRTTPQQRKKNTRSRYVDTLNPESNASLPDAATGGVFMPQAPAANFTTLSGVGESDPQHQPMPQHQQQQQYPQ